MREFYIPAACSEDAYAIGSFLNHLGLQYCKVDHEHYRLEVDLDEVKAHKHMLHLIVEISNVQDDQNSKLGIIKE